MAYDEDLADRVRAVGWLRVVTVLDDRQLEQWVARGVELARSLPPKRR